LNSSELSAEHNRRRKTAAELRKINSLRKSWHDKRSRRRSRGWRRKKEETGGGRKSL
jgi:hypothetical protein